MKHLAISLFIFFIFVPIADLTAQDSVYVAQEDTQTEHTRHTSQSRYERRTLHYRNFWSTLVPNHLKLQFAGSIGMISAGVGWHYGRQHDQWETDLLFGYLPKFQSDRAKLTTTLKQSYMPWNVDIKKMPLTFTPLVCGLFFNTVFGEDFWASEPSKYPKKYYGFSTKIRANVFVGQRINYLIPERKRRYNKSISAYYELSTCDLYLASYFTNHHIKLKDILSLSFGLRFEGF